MASALEGIKVVEMALAVLSPHTGAHLSDMGAEVIKVEHPAGGDMARAMTTIRQVTAAAKPGMLNFMFEQDNRGKKSVTADLTKPEGVEIVHKLVKTADIFLTNYQMEVLKKLKVDYETLSIINPKLIYAIATGWGLKGPDKDNPAFDFVAFARSGIMSTMGEPDGIPPSCLPGFGDHITAMTLAYGIMLALYHRERTGEGQMVHTSLLAGLTEAASLNLQASLTTGQDIPNVSRKSANNPLWNFYQTKDKRWLQLAMLQTDRHWPDFCEATELQNIQNDPKFSNHAQRLANNLALIKILDETFAKRTYAEWESRFKGKNIIRGVVSRFIEQTKDPQLLENGVIVEYDHPSQGRIKHIGPPVYFSKSPGQIRGAAPELGQNTEEVLLDIGYSWEDIATLKDKKVIL